MLTINEEGHDHFDDNLLSEFRAICSPSSRTDIKMHTDGPKILMFTTTILILGNRGNNYVLLKLNRDKENMSLLPRKKLYNSQQLQIKDQVLTVR